MRFFESLPLEFAPDGAADQTAMAGHINTGIFVHQHGECLNSGVWPSKWILFSGIRASFRNSDFGFNFALPVFDCCTINSRVLVYIVIIVTAYLLGSIPTGYLVARARGIDIRTVGSGNIGAANVFRILGRPAGIFVLVADGLKGFRRVFMAGGFCRSTVRRCAG